MANSGRVRERQLDGVEVDVPTPASQPGDVFPAGVILHFAGSAAPTNWLICDGSVISRATYPNLFAAIGTTYGAGDGSTTFGIPDLRGKMIVGKHTSGTFVTLGGTGGEENHVLTTAELASHAHGGSTSSVGDHAHGVSDPGHSHGTDQPGTTQFAVTTDLGLFGASGSARFRFTDMRSNTGSSGTGVSIQGAGGHNHSISTDAQGGGGGHNNMPPYTILHHIIKAS